LPPPIKIIAVLLNEIKRLMHPLLTPKNKSALAVAHPPHGTDSEQRRVSSESAQPPMAGE
jgi:hypothetical protein